MEAETMTDLKASTVQKTLLRKNEKTHSLAGTIQPRTVNGKDVRTQKQKAQDAKLLRFEVTMKNNFDDALARDQDEKALIATL